MQFRRVNNITGWVVCIIACMVYVLTAEAGGSLWDCGEFVSSAYKLQIPHPPGAPLFVLLGRFFIILFGDNPLTAAKAVNIMNALASGFTILFLFWTITHFARRIVLGWNTVATASLSSLQVAAIMGAGAVGALAYTFTDSFWYSAVEGEVYALSSFFTALVFWAILKWDHAAEAEELNPALPRYADRWIIFIFFMMGLSIGVHLLNLLTIPAIVLVYYFRKRSHFDYKVIRKWFMWTVVIGGVLAILMATLASKAEESVLAEREADIERYLGRDITVSDSTLAGLCILGIGIAIGLLYLVESLNKKRKEEYGGMYIFFLLGCVLTGIVQVGVIQYSIKAAGAFDRLFVNSFDLPFFVGFTFFFVLLGVVIWAALRYASRRNWPYLRLAVWCLTFMLIGYSTYVTTMIRSNADPAVDMYNVDNPNSLVGYLGREQYGDFPLIYGQKFTADPMAYREKGTKYQKVGDKYVEIGKDQSLVYLPEDKMIFPRVWDASNDQNHADYYAVFLDIGKNQQGQYERPPTFGDNIKFFTNYQIYWMYIRYFMWNFSGKQNDVQGLFSGNVRDGNWITGVPFMDKALYGDQSLMPDSMKNNKANNKMFMLPFILGLIGMVYQYRKRGSDFVVSFLLFFFTGLAIVLYLNQPGFQPRERDYAFVGSFYAFAIWIGLAVLAFIEIGIRRYRQLVKDNLTLGGVIALVMLVAAVAAGSSPLFAIGFFILFALAGAGIPYLMMALKKPATITYTSIVLCLIAAPMLMASQEWDDHDRSHKVLARDLARDYLESCAPNAIVFSYGDNDTYPLWYAQEVEGIRPDVRVINHSLLGIDWYINQLRYKVNQSAPIDVIYTPEQIQGSNRDQVMYKANPAIPENRYYDLYDMMVNYIGSEDPSRKEQRGDQAFNTFPVRKVFLPVDHQKVLANGTVNASDTGVVNEVQFDISRNYILKNDLAVLAIIASNAKNGWNRPIYFTHAYRELGFGRYLRKDGLTYRLVPLENTHFDRDGQSDMNAEKMLSLMLDEQKWRSGNADLPGVYFDEENRRHLMSIRQTHVELAFYLAQRNRKEDARKILERADKMMLQENMPYGMSSRGNQHNEASIDFMTACYLADAKDLAKKVAASVKKDLVQQITFYESLSGVKRENHERDLMNAQEMLKQLEARQKAYENMPAAPEAGATISNDTSR
ncbi:MAG TPA: DUF2723 domain-containing protein [Chitinophagaceae bacterium]